MAHNPTTSHADLSSLRIDRNAPRRKGSAWILLSVAALALLLVAGFFLLRGSLSPTPSVRTAAVQADAAGARGGSARLEVLTANGYVVPRRKASVSSEVGGRLKALYVDEGDTATAGQILGVLNNEDIQAQIQSVKADAAAARAARAEAEAQLALARQEHGRQKDMLSRGLVAQAAFDRSQAELDVAEARNRSASARLASVESEIRLAEENLEKTYIRAPFQGTVLRKEAEVGEIVSPIPANGGLTRGAIVTMADLNSSEMVVDVNEGYVSRVREGQPAEVELDAYTGVRFPARVRQVVPTADRQKATVQVKVAFLSPDTRILPEMGGKVFFMSDSGPDSLSSTGNLSAGAATLVPKAAVREVDGRSVVYVVKDGKARLRPVQVMGSASGNQVRIAAGLAAGELVIVAGPETLKDGARVQVEGEPGS